MSVKIIDDKLCWVDKRSSAHYEISFWEAKPNPWNNKVPRLSLTWRDEEGRAKGVHSFVDNDSWTVIKEHVNNQQTKKYADLTKKTVSSAPAKVSIKKDPVFEFINTLKKGDRIQLSPKKTIKSERCNFVFDGKSLTTDHIYLKPIDLNRGLIGDVCKFTIEELYNYSIDHLTITGSLGSRLRSKDLQIACDTQIDLTR